MTVWFITIHLLLLFEKLFAKFGIILTYFLQHSFETLVFTLLYPLTVEHHYRHRLRHSMIYFQDPQRLLQQYNTRTERYSVKILRRFRELWTQIFDSYGSTCSHLFSAIIAFKNSLIIHKHMSLSETSNWSRAWTSPLYLVKHGHSEKPGKGLDFSPREKWGWKPKQYNYRWIFNETTTMIFI